MANKSSYYYLKIKENFFDTEDMKLLENMDNGYQYSNILMKMYLLSLKNGGKLMYKDKIPYNSKMLSTILNHNIDILDKAINIFKELNLIEVMDTGAIFMIDIQNFIGKSSDEADRIRAFRSRIETEKQLENKSDVQMYDKCTTDVANIKDKDITKDRDKDRNIYMSEFESLWEIYPNKKGKDVAIKKYLLARKQGATYEQIRQGLESYIHYCKINNLETQYIKHGSTWFSQKAWKDDYNTNLKGQKQIIPEWFNKEIEASPLTEEELKEMNDLLSEFKED
jgi:phage replisome organizer N-terminal domain protein|nr:MAG TPA: DnaD like replication protein [Caudoviricetes sp.]